MRLHCIIHCTLIFQSPSPASQLPTINLWLNCTRKSRRVLQRIRTWSFLRFRSAVFWPWSWLEPRGKRLSKSKLPWLYPTTSKNHCKVKIILIILMTFLDHNLLLNNEKSKKKLTSFPFLIRFQGSSAFARHSQEHWNGKLEQHLCPVRIQPRWNVRR